MIGYIIETDEYIDIIRRDWYYPYFTEIPFKSIKDKTKIGMIICGGCRQPKKCSGRKTQTQINI